jgi:arsenate reductase
MNSEMEKAKPFNVLFLCSDNSARSVMAEAILNELGQGRFRAFSAGPQPASQLNPFALAVLHNAGFATDGLRSKSWDEFSGANAPELDFVFTLCDSMTEETQAHWAGQPTIAHWSLPDPDCGEDNEVMQHLALADTFRMLCNRIAAFSALPMAGLDRLTPQNHVEGFDRPLARSAAA